MRTDINTILRQPANKGYSQFGADMGRRSQMQGKPERLHLQRMQMLDHGCYDAGGAYWGQGNPLYCAFSDQINSQNDPPIRVFVRASDRDEAKELVLAELKKANEPHGNWVWSFYH